jgi:DNA-binding NarL/FixJ family response regulator
MGLRVFLSESKDVAVIGELSDGDAALSFVEREAPDVVLMDLSMPGVDGIAATRAISAAHPEIKVVVLTTFVDRERVLDAVDAGAVGYLLKDADPEELVRSIRAAARGESPFAPRAAQALLADRSDRSARGDPAAILTDREREVLRLVGRGLSNKEIGRQLGISEKTVKAHLGAAFQRIGVRDRTQAALWAERNELLEES